MGIKKSHISYCLGLIRRIAYYYFLDKFLVRKCLNFLDNKYKGNKVLILILHGGKSKERVAYLKEYYSGFLQCDFLFYADYWDLDNNVLKVSYSDEYQSNEMKHINILNITSRFGVIGKYESIFCVDDDTFVNIQELLKKLDGDKKWTQPNTILGEMLIQSRNTGNPFLRKHEGLCYPSGGAGYLIHNTVFAVIPRFRMYFTDYSDVSLGINVKKSQSVILEADSAFHSQPVDFYNLSKENINNAVSFHYVKTREQFEFYREQLRSL
ncbi:hypothetical protein [Filimonas effusa]|uniref:Fringe-like glycosyltransferase domain-containing protein n=1 Tax=Filimonas effusa TaxID=2508721 RepID=A0A4V1M9N6_9BACT|nr:hypothetical protein [Filimonas effusa]RXK81840.1 hypothetical protein ESB13_18805 [Filimonas effusa]